MPRFGAKSETPLPSAGTGPILDQQALTQYRRRLAELDDELDAAAIRGTPSGMRSGAPSVTR